jgi:hypothetical protein
MLKDAALLISTISRTPGSGCQVLLSVAHAAERAIDAVLHYLPDTVMSEGFAMLKHTSNLPCDGAIANAETNAGQTSDLPAP